MNKRGWEFQGGDEDDVCNSTALDHSESGYPSTKVAFSAGSAENLAPGSAWQPTVSLQPVKSDAANVHGSRAPLLRLHPRRECGRGRR